VIRVFVWIAAVFLAGGCATSPHKLERYSYTQPQMGLPFQIVLYAPDKAVADAAAEAAFGRIKELNDVLSDYDTDSELSRLSQTGGKMMPVRVGADLWHMLSRSQKFARETDGAFDITAGPAISLWRKARREKKLPDAGKLKDALAAVGYEKLRLDARNQTAELLVPYMRLDLGAIAKGYATDEALKVLEQRGITRALVSGAGDMSAGEAPPGKRGWRVELAGYLEENDSTRPKEFVLLRHRGLATSGDLFQFVDIDGVRYSHIVNPKTGMGLTDHGLVVVIAKDGTTADSLSTAVSVLGPEKGIKLVERYGACARVLRRQVRGAGGEKEESRCFSQFVTVEEPGS
jgi:thiamine biosynthesis lipoprotein